MAHPRLSRCSLLLVPASSLLSAGCTIFEPGYIESPILDRGAPIVVRQPVNVEIQNGAGAYLYAGPAGTIATHPDLSLFDGKLVITMLWTTGETTTQTLLSEPGQPVDIAWDERKREFYLKSAPKPAVEAAGPKPAITSGTGTPIGAGRRPTRVTVRDSAGHIVDDGPPDERNEYDAWAPGAGKLFVTTTFSEGPPSTQELQFSERQLHWDWDEDSYAWFDWDPNSQQYVIVDPTQPVGALIRSVKIAAGKGRYTDRAPSIGVIVGPDSPPLRGANKIDYNNLDFGLSLGKIGVFKTKVELGFLWGDETTRSNDAGGVRGFVFQGGPNAGTGGASGAPSVSTLKTSYEAQSARFVMDTPFPGSRLTEDSRWHKQDVFSFTRSERRYTGTMQFPALPDVLAEEGWKVTEYTLGAGVGVIGKHTFQNRMSLSGGARLDALYYWGDYSGNHHYSLPGRNFTQSTDDSKNGFTWGSVGHVTLSYAPSRQSEFSVRGDVSYRDKSVMLQPLVSPGGRPFLQARSTHSYGVSVSYRFNF